MLETDEDRLWISGLHQEIQHDCHLSPDDGCDLYLNVENAYLATKERIAKLKALNGLDELFGEQSKGDASTPVIA